METTRHAAEIAASNHARARVVTRLRAAFEVFLAEATPEEHRLLLEVLEIHTANVIGEPTICGLAAAMQYAAAPAEEERQAA